MKRKYLFILLSILVTMSMVLAACGTPTEAPTEEPVVEEPTEEPTEEPMAFEPTRLDAPNCDYGGKIKSIAAVDAYTVEFTMCKPDPAFPAKAAFTPFGI